MSDKSKQPATGNDIKTITGLEDHGFITAILALGATPKQVLQAFEWFQAEEKDITTGPDIAIAKRVYEILKENQEMCDICERL